MKLGKHKGVYFQIKNYLQIIRRFYTHEFCDFYSAGYDKNNEAVFIIKNNIYTENELKLTIIPYFRSIVAYLKWNDRKNCWKRELESIETRWINTSRSLDSAERSFYKNYIFPRLCILRGKLTEDKLFTHNPKHSKL